MTSLEIMMRCGWDVTDALEITKGRRRIMVEPTTPIADANERKYKGLNIPTEDLMRRTFERLVVNGEDVYVNLMAGSSSDWHEVHRLLSGVHLTEEKKVEIPH